MKLGQFRGSILVTGLMIGALSLSACQKPEPDNSAETDMSSEQDVPMSAEPAEPNDAIVATDAPADDVADDTVAIVTGGVVQIQYLCTPELKVDATYKDDANQVVLETAQGTLTLDKTNDGTNPEVYEVKTTLDGSQGITEWRVAHKARETGVIRVLDTSDKEISTYECKREDKPAVAPAG